MAQWMGQFSGLTHDTKVQDLEVSLRSAVVALQTSVPSERASKSKAVLHLCERLFAARRKSLNAKISVFNEREKRSKHHEQLAALQERAQHLNAQGVEGIKKEFDIDESALQSIARRAS